MVLDQLSKLRRRFRNASDEAWKVLEQDLDAGQEALQRGVDKAQEIALNAEEHARAAARKGTELYTRYEVNERAAGAAVGAKAGFFASRFAGPLAPVAMKVAVPTGVVVGIALGPEGVRRFATWRDRDAANDETSVVVETIEEDDNEPPKFPGLDND